MSGEETLAQVYREVESPEVCRNFKKVGPDCFSFTSLFADRQHDVFLAVILISRQVADDDVLRQLDGAGHRDADDRAGLACC